MPTPFPSHPMQPVLIDDQGVARFKVNALIKYLFDPDDLMEVDE